MSLASQDGGYFYFKVLDSYRGSRDIWRIWDTLMAAGWVAFGLGVLYLWEKYQKKATLGPTSQETRIDKN